MIAKPGLPSYVTQQQVRQLFATILKPRDRALFSLAYAYGLRVGEIVLLDRDDLDLERCRIRIPRLKGGLSGESPIFRNPVAPPAPVPRTPAEQGRGALHGSPRQTEEEENSGPFPLLRCGG